MALISIVPVETWAAAGRANPTITASAIVRRALNFT
jgi:hypothetical protein